MNNIVNLKLNTFLTISNQYTVFYSKMQSDAAQRVSRDSGQDVKFAIAGVEYE